MQDKDFDLLKNISVPPHSEQRKTENISQSIQAFEKECEKKSIFSQGTHETERLTHNPSPQKWSSFMRILQILFLFVVPLTIALSIYGILPNILKIPRILAIHSFLISLSIGFLIMAMRKFRTWHKSSHRENLSRGLVPLAASICPLLTIAAMTQMQDFSGKASSYSPLPGVVTFSNSNAAPSSREYMQRHSQESLPMVDSIQLPTVKSQTRIMAQELPTLPETIGTRDKFDDVEQATVKQTKEEPVSTFSIDVDTASYGFVRRSLESGTKPSKDAVRIEELINYFDYDYATPEASDHPFKPSVTVTPSPWNDGNKLLHIGLKGYDLPLEENRPANLVFLIDTSGSMSSQDKLPLLINGFKMMVENLSEEDTIAIVTYAGSAGVALEPTKVSDKRKIISALENLRSGGSTAGGAGLTAAYALAEENFKENGVNRIFLATDGDFNVGLSSNQQLEDFIEEKRESGIFLSVLGFGRGNYNDSLMQVLAQKGNGNAAYIDSLNEARKVLVEEAGSTIFTIAKDVKIQVEFNPQQISEYRLIGYETRHLNREDFNNDKVDAGEIGSGHTVTAIYEITPVGSDTALNPPLRYGATEEPTSEQEISEEYAFLKLRYKQPEATKSTLMTYPITRKDELDSLSQASDDVRFSVAVAAFGQLLKGGKYIQSFNYDDVLELAKTAKGIDEFGYRAEFLNLVRLAK